MLSRLLLLYRKIVPAAIREPVSRAINWPPGGTISYSAHGEDLFVRGWLDELGVNRTAIRYFDIGSNHPSILSNTFLFYRMGGSGVLVEPTPHEASLLAKTRRRDILIRSGVSFDEHRTATLFMFEPSVYNSFDRSEAAQTLQKIRDLGLAIEQCGEISVPLIPIMEMATNHFGEKECHFLSIDVEGLDSKILKSVDWKKFRPWFVCCERPDDDLTQLILGVGYERLAQFPHNAIFARIDVLQSRIQIL